MNEEELKLRVLQARSDLQEIGADKRAQHYFCLKYPEYKPVTESDYHRLRNLWYGKVAEEDFTKKLEAFVTFQKAIYQ
jgi:hypothetical protein